MCACEHVPAGSLLVQVQTWYANNVVHVRTRTALAFPTSQELLLLDPQ